MHRTRYFIGLAALAFAIFGALALWNTLTSAKEQDGMQLRVEFRDARGLRSGATFARCRLRRTVARRSST